jgi:hypothetical protein
MYIIYMTNVLKDKQNKTIDLVSYGLITRYLCLLGLSTTSIELRR